LEGSFNRGKPTIYIYPYAKNTYSTYHLKRIANVTQNIYKKNGIDINVTVISNETHSYLNNKALYRSLDAYVGITRITQAGLGGDTIMNYGDIDTYNPDGTLGGRTNKSFWVTKSSVISGGGVASTDPTSIYRTGLGVAHEALHQYILKAYGFLWEQRMHPNDVHVDVTYPVNLNTDADKVKPKDWPTFDSQSTRPIEKIPPARKKLILLFFKQGNYRAIYSTLIKKQFNKTHPKSELAKLKSELDSEY
jgi:ABC-type transport system substrate-binding protein